MAGCQRPGDHRTFWLHQRHAGGILWYGNLLYTVDTTKGLRVFDLETVFEAATGKSDVCGLDASDGT
ncbi:hypothetical protein ABTX81_09415 [Kitasatospora sp. NPDC097605]|uniref:hypothetical protein n=1 Tax=Kitasatospora sp. NPDC097605 TaxID=3157226 RepID=UPI003319D6C7